MYDYEDTALETTGTPLERAKAQWKHGWTIPFDLAAALIEEGYDVPALEARYRA